MEGQLWASSKLFAYRLNGELKPPDASSVEAEIQKAVSQGWKFVQLATGGVGGSMISTWTYLVFEQYFGAS